MNKLSVSLKNCYGIQSLDHEFDFSNSKAKAYAIYAPNGMMKTSFTRTLEALAKGDVPKEERYNRTSTHAVKADVNEIPKEMIYVLKSEIDIRSDSPAITNILVNPSNKARYDEILVDLDKLKKSLTKSLQKLSKVKQDDIEKTILGDWQEKDLASCILKINATTLEGEFSPYAYAIIFDPKTKNLFPRQRSSTNAIKNFSIKPERFTKKASLIPRRQKLHLQHWTNRDFFRVVIAFT
jgi:hypothetical protein